MTIVKNEHANENTGALVLLILDSASKGSQFAHHPVCSNHKDTMKTNSLLLASMLFVFSLIFASCGTAATPETPTIEVHLPTGTPVPPQEPTPTATLAPTETPVPTEAPTPTETPPPLPCTVIFDSDREGNKEIYVMDPDGGNLRNLTNNSGDDWDPAWSPDGSQIAFVSNRESEQAKGQQIYVMNADGSNVRQLTTTGWNEYPDWSYDGSKITFSSDEDGDKEIYVINLDGSGQQTNLTNNTVEDVQAAWSPIDNRITWLSGRDGNWNIFVMDGDGGNVRQLTDDSRVFDVSWTVSGQIFTHWDNQKYGCFNCVIDADGSNVIDAGGKGELQRYLPFWTLDGNRVELVSASLEGGDEEIYLVSELYEDIFYNLTNDPASDRNPDWPSMCGPGTTPRP